MKIKDLNQLIRQRRSIYPNSFVQGKEIPREVIEDLLENANWAPTHRMTEPWRFRVMTGNSLNELSEYMGAYYQQNTAPAKYSEMKHKKTMKKPLLSSHVIAICMQRDPKESVPEGEEIASVAMAVQNIWLSGAVHGIGMYWSSPKSMYHAGEFLGLQEGESCLGVLYMGYYEGGECAGKRQPIAEKVVWM